jgi:6,7-dimethyl-8-ribityllumazine synthase
MIKGISFLRPTGNAAAYDRLASFFAALGFASGKGWKEENSRGAAFLAPLGNLEFVDGQFPSTADVLVEVTALDAVHQAAETWLRAQGGEAAVARLSPITETHWKSRIFMVEPEPGFSFSFWAWTDPIKGKPVAVEGDLSAAGMKFAIVVARWNAVITDRLLEGALDALLRSGAARADIQVVRDHHARLFTARRNCTLRSHLQRGRPRHRPVAAGDRHSALLWRAHLRDA